MHQLKTIFWSVNSKSFICHYIFKWASCKSSSILSASAPEPRFLHTLRAWWPNLPQPDKIKRASVSPVFLSQRENCFSKTSIINSIMFCSSPLYLYAFFLFGSRVNSLNGIFPDPYWACPVHEMKCCISLYQSAANRNYRVPEYNRQHLIFSTSQCIWLLKSANKSAPLRVH